MKKTREQFKEKHDPKTCFRCRLHDLYEEIGNRHDNDGRFMLMSMAEACGSMLSQMDTEDVMLFMMAVQKFINEEIEEGKWDTKH